jgi:hypothetical protein
LSDENGPGGESGPPDEEEQVEETRRVRPLFRFGRRNSKKEEAPGPEETPSPEETPAPDPVQAVEDGDHSTVRPVRVVKFVPPDTPGTDDVPVDVEPTFTEEEEAPFVVEEEAPFVVEEEAPFVVEEEAPFVVEEEAPLAPAEEAPFTEEGSTEAPTAYDSFEETIRTEPVHDSTSVQEEAETGEEFQFRQEETPATMEDQGHEGPQVPGPAPQDETKPHYHKYLKPDEELLQRKQTKGPATGFDRDMDADAGEIDFGIDLIDPSERKKSKRRAPAPKEPGPKKGVGGHDFDGEVVTTQSGSDIGVDFQKRRKRRL